MGIIAWVGCALSWRWGDGTFGFGYGCQGGTLGVALCPVLPLVLEVRKPHRVSQTLPSRERHVVLGRCAAM